MSTTTFQLARPPTLLTRTTFAARRYWVLGVLIVIVTAGAASVLGSRVSSNVATYEADALIVAQTLEVRAEELPRAAAAVFRAGTVARSVATDDEVPYPPNSLIPDHLDFEPVENTIAMRVVGRDASAETAARIANLGAAALVQELNRVGPGFGVFTLHTRAVTPTESSNEPPPLVLIGVVAGLILAIGLIGLVVSLQKPVLDPRQASAIAGRPLIGDIVLDSNDNSGSLANVAGLAGVSFSLGLGSESVRYLVAANLSARKLSLLGCVLARSVARGERNVILVDPTSPDAPCGNADEQRFILRRDSLDPDASRKSPTIVIGRYSASTKSSRTQAIDPLQGTVALVVGAGVATQRLASATAALGDRVDGIIFVHQESVRDFLRRRTVPTQA